MSDVPESTPAETWRALNEDPRAVLIDVRTDAEWTFVGMPDLSATGKPVLPIAWQLYPSMAVNPGFIEDLHRAGLGAEHRLYFLCRSGARSLAAARAARSAGFPHVFNVTDGFEGPVDADGHRRTTAGWIAAGLPWRQR
ncbi:MAG: rhodanese-like domain-containing protein [Acetobacteraceae bacterium]